MKHLINYIKSLSADMGMPCLLTVFVLMISQSSPSPYQIYAPLIVWITSNAFLKEFNKIQSFTNLYEKQLQELKEKRERVKKEFTSFFSGLSKQTANDFAETISADEDQITMFMLLKKHGITVESRSHPLEKLLSALIGTIIGIICFIPTKMHLYGFILTSILAAFFKSILKGSFNLEEFIWYGAILLSTFSIYYYGF